jgi:glycosyltransferase involved in cell wall biosynthesis
MLGTGIDTRGGIAAVIAGYREQGLFDRWPIDYIATHRDGTPLLKFLAAARALFALLFLVVRHRAGVLHVHGASRASFWRKSVYMAIGLAAGWRIVFHLHGGGFARFHKEECGPVAQAVIRFFLDRATWIVVVSETWQRWVRSVTSNPRIACIPNPVALPATVSAWRQHGLVVFSGRCEASKGIFDLLEAAGVLRAQVPGLRIECAGDGDLGRSSAFVLPSYAEGLPMSLLEAMAAGCAVVATRVGGIPDLVTDGVDGLLVPPGDPDALAAALLRVLHDRAFAERLGNAARETIANRYAVERSLERLEHIYAGLGVRREAVRKAAAAQTLQEEMS